MNERIKQLVDQVNIKHQVGDICRMVSDQELEKFAELIVLDVLAKKDSRWCDGDIKQHFGVE